MSHSLMSLPWSLYVIVIAIGNILLCWWLLYWTSKPGKNEAKTTGHTWDDDLQELNNPLPKWWLYWFYLTIFFGLAYLAAYPGLGTYQGLLGWDQIEQYESEVAQAKTQYGDVYQQFAGHSISDLGNNANALKYGQRLFTDNCALCHGSDARGAPGFPNLTDNDWLYGGSSEQIYQSITQGRHGIMPPFESLLSNQAVEQTAAYVASLSGQSFSAQLINPGKENFALYCAACHGSDGRGNQAMGAPNLSDDIWLYGRRIETIKSNIRKGLKGEMPAHQEILGEDKIRLVTAYVLSLSQRYSQE